MKKLLISFLLSIPLISFAGNFFVQLHGVSHHLEKRKYVDWNEKNIGLGLQYKIDKDWSVQGGFYKNSESTPWKTYWTKYLIADYTPIHLGNFSAGAFGGLATGYRYNPSGIPAGGLLVRFNEDNFNITSRFIPKANAGGSAVVSLEVGFKF